MHWFISVKSGFYLPAFEISRSCRTASGVTTSIPEILQPHWVCTTKYLQMRRENQPLSKKHLNDSHFVRWILTSKTSVILNFHQNHLLHHFTESHELPVSKNNFTIKKKILTILFMVKYEKITLFDEFLVLLGPIISRLFTCSNEEKNKQKQQRVLALVLSLWSRVRHFGSFQNEVEWDLNWNKNLDLKYV